MTVGIILAGGKGTRLKSVDRNKTTLPFLGKAMILYAVDLFEKTADVTLVVVSFAGQTVRDVIGTRKNLFFVEQGDPMGTGHAVRRAVEDIEQKLNLAPKIVLVGYGDHMMFYSSDVVRRIMASHQANHAAITLLTTIADDPDKLVWGRIVRDEQGRFLRIVEQKDATSEERLINEVNPGFYCFDYQFLKDNIGEIKKSPISGEYYLTDLIEMAVSQGKKVEVEQVPFSQVGIGVNTPEELEKSQQFLEEVHDASST